jgi:hypothetical protein
MGSVKHNLPTVQTAHTFSSSRLPLDMIDVGYFTSYPTRLMPQQINSRINQHFISDSDGNLVLVSCL